MGKINQDLIEWIVRKLGLSSRAVYSRISRIVNETGLERDIAALKLGRENGANLNKFSTPAQRAELRGQASERDDRPEAPPRADAPARRASAKKTVKKKSKGNRIFVVYGRDEALRKSMFEFLRALGLAPQEWHQALAEAKGNNPYVGSVIDEVMEQAQAVVVMLSPDDLVQLKPHFVGRDEKNSEGKPQGQARPNVLFEAGMAMAAHSEKTVMVRIGRIKPFSDVFGRHIPTLGDDFESRNDFANRLHKAGCTVNRVGTDWTRAGSFMPAEPKPAKKVLKTKKA